MLYGDIFELDEDVNPVLCENESKFYKLYSALMQCHAIVKDKHLYEHTLHDIQTQKESLKFPIWMWFIFLLWKV